MSKAPQGAFFLFRKLWPAGTWLYEEATRHVRPADPTDPGDAADLSKSMGYSCVPNGTTAPAGPTRAQAAALFHAMVANWLKVEETKEQSRNGQAALATTRFRPARLAA